MKHIFISLFIGACLLCMPSCQQKAEFENPLGLLSHEVKLTSEAGYTPVLVYSNTQWTVSLTENVDWAGIDRLEGEGMGQVKFNYAQNYGPERRVGIAFEAGVVRDTVYMVQAEAGK